MKAGMGGWTITVYLFILLWVFEPWNVLSTQKIKLHVKIYKIGTDLPFYSFQNKSATVMMPGFNYSSNLGKKFSKMLGKT